MPRNGTEFTYALHRCPRCDKDYYRTLQYFYATPYGDGMHNRCKFCMRELQRARQQSPENNPTDLARKRKYRKENPDKIAAYNRAYYLDHYEEAAAAGAKRYAAMKSLGKAHRG